MNTINTLRTTYLQSNRTVDTIKLENEEATKYFYLYNHEGLLYRLFDSKTAISDFFNNNPSEFLEFEDDETLDNYLLNLQF